MFHTVEHSTKCPVFGGEINLLFDRRVEGSNAGTSSPRYVTNTSINLSGWWADVILIVARLSRGSPRDGSL